MPTRRAACDRAETVSVCNRLRTYHGRKRESAFASAKLFSH